MKDLIEADDVRVHEELQNIDLSHHFFAHVEAADPVHPIEKNDEWRREFCDPEKTLVK